MDKYLQLLRALRAGRDISKEDLKYFASFHQNFDESQYEKLKGKLATEEGLKNMTDEDFDTYVNEARKMLTTDVYKEKVYDIAKDAAVGKTNEKVTAGLNLLLAGTDIATSLSQISQSNARQAGIRRPARPAVLQRDQMLAQALDEAHRGTLDQSAALQPARLANLDTYRSDLAHGATAAAGQPGAYGAYGQAAAGRMYRANADLVPLGNQIKQQEQANYRDLLGTRQAENVNINQSQSQFYPQDLYQYGIDRAAAQELGSQGRYNLRSSLTGAGQSIQDFAGQAAKKRYDDIYNQMSAYGHDHAENAAKAWGDLNDIHQGYKMDYQDPQMGGNYTPKHYYRQHRNAYEAGYI